MKKKGIVIIVVMLIIAIIVGLTAKNKIEEKVIIRQVKNDKQLYKLYEDEDDENRFTKALRYTLGLPVPLAIPIALMSYRHVSSGAVYDYDSSPIKTGGVTIPQDSVGGTTNSSSSKSLLESATDALSESTSSSSRDYSTTNIQVENVDEADVVKTDGNYIYSISNNYVVITDTKDINNPKVVATLRAKSDAAPEELLIYKDKLVVISSKGQNYSKQTIVEILDLSNIESPRKMKTFELDEGYYTSRCIDNKLYIISSGRVKTDNNKIKHDYKEDNTTKTIDFKNMYTVKDVDVDYQTVIATYDLDSNNDVNVESYFIDVSNAYVSEKGLYLLNSKYSYGESGFKFWNVVKVVFNFKGIFGTVDAIENLEDEDDDEYYGQKTTIYKFDIDNNKGKLVYNNKTKIDGKTIDQYSLDEKDGHLRVASYDSKGAQITILDEKLNVIGKTEKVAERENLYATRFMGNKAYFVTYRNTDPLYVVDLEDEKNPKILGELHIPGYSTYLHPYDENHIIGIGIETKETTRRNAYGEVVTTGATVEGMKMALFDVSNVDYPKQVSQVVIGDSRTKSAILSNPKALLFSKEKNLIAIPVNNYKDELTEDEIDVKDNKSIRSYYQQAKDYISEGYLVYNINLEDGITLKGRITHTANPDNKAEVNKSLYTTTTNLLRGLYINDNLFTVDENEIKVTDLKSFNLIADLIITLDKNDNLVGVAKDINTVEKNVLAEDIEKEKQRLEEEAKKKEEEKKNTVDDNTVNNTVSNKISVRNKIYSTDTIEE